MVRLVRTVANVMANACRGCTSHVRHGSLTVHDTSLDSWVECCFYSDYHYALSLTLRLLTREGVIFWPSVLRRCRVAARKHFSRSHPPGYRTQQYIVQAA